MTARLADSGLEVFDLYSFSLEPGTDVSSFAPAMEMGGSFGAKYATVMGADTDWSRQRDNFIRTCDLAAQFSLTCRNLARVSAFAGRAAFTAASY